MSEELTPSSDFFTDVRRILADARRAAYTAVNSAMVAAYWQIGRRIVEEEQGGQAKAAYGEGLLMALSKELTEEFGKGFSLANLRNFRQFYLTYLEAGIRYTLCSELSWSHNRLIMRESDDQARLWYLRESKAQNWSVRQLQRQIETHTYQRLLSTQAPAEKQEPASAKPFIRDFIKDPYVLEFLGLPEYPSATETEIDMYVRMFDDLKRGPDDNPTLGIILCADKDETIVQYSVLKGSEQLFASKYRTLLPTEAELTAELERERRSIEERQPQGGDA